MARGQVGARVFLTTFRPPDHFSRGGGRVARFWPSGGLVLHVFEREAPENGAEGAVLENLCDFECGK